CMAVEPAPRLRLAATLANYAGLLRDKDRLGEAETLARESVEIRRQVAEEDWPPAASSLDLLASIQLRRNRLDEARSSASECLCIRTRKLPGNWRRFDAQATLANIVAAQKNYQEAEPLLLSAYNEMVRLQGTIPFSARKRLSEIRTDISRLYAQTG